MTGLPPRIHPLVRSFLADQAGPAGLLDRFGSPLNVLFPEIFTANVAGFRDELDAAGLRYRICYAHKANQGRAFVRAARAAGIGIDVASPGELDSALAAGFPPSLIEATGPKGRDFLGVLAGSGVTVNVDNLWELGELARLGRAAGCRVPVLVRMCGLGPEDRGRPSRFGVPAARFGAVTDLLAAARDAVDFLGLSFHLDSSETGDRARAVDECLRLLERAWAPGSARGSWTSAAASARPSPTPRSRSGSTARRSGAAWPATVRRSPGAAPHWDSGSRTPGSAARWCPASTQARPAAATCCASWRPARCRARAAGQSPGCCARTCWSCGWSRARRWPTTRASRWPASSSPRRPPTAACW